MRRTPYESAVAPKSLRSRTLLSLVRHMSGAAFGSGLTLAYEEILFIKIYIFNPNFVCNCILL